MPDSLVLAGLDVEHRDLTLHLQLKSPPVPAAPAPAEDSELQSPPEPTALASKPRKGSTGSHQPFARRVYEWGWRRRCSLRRR